MSKLSQETMKNLTNWELKTELTKQDFSLSI